MWGQEPMRGVILADGIVRFPIPGSEKQAQSFLGRHQAGETPKVATFYEKDHVSGGMNGTCHGCFQWHCQVKRCGMQGGSLPLPRVPEKTLEAPQAHLYRPEERKEGAHHSRLASWCSGSVGKTTFFHHSADTCITETSAPSGIVSSYWRLYSDYTAPAAPPAAAPGQLLSTRYR